MSIRHHPDITTLMSCAAGSQPEAIAAVVAAHLSVCAECRREVGRLERIGVALFDDLKPAEVAAAAPVIAARAGEADVETAATVSAAGDVPGPLVGRLGPSLDALSWKWVAPGVEQVRVPLSPDATGDLRLLRVAPGREFPDHGHGGEELTLMLRGSYSDEIGTFGPGDVADLDPDVEHRPVADPMEGCICLVAYERPARFKTFLARLLQPVLGF